MGGQGSGRWGLHTKRTTVEECLAIDAAKLARDGLLERAPGMGSLRWTSTATGEEVASVAYLRRAEGNGLALDLFFTRTFADGTKDSICDHVELLATQQPVGGERWWFACPVERGGSSCGRRMRKLYPPPGSRRFGCRGCHDLTYASSQESHKYDRLFATLARETGLDPAFVRHALRR